MSDRAAGPEFNEQSKCPKCGAEREDPGYFACGSRDSNAERRAEPFQSYRCKVAERDRRIAELEAEDLVLGRLLRDYAGVCVRLRDEVARLTEQLAAAKAEIILARLAAWHRKGRWAYISIDDGLGASAGWEVELLDIGRAIHRAEYTNERWGGVTLAELITEALDEWEKGEQKGEQHGCSSPSPPQS